ncbi:MAG: response regulator transcription factor [Flavobacteriales bacterium]|nr:response regulator transcription factor [Flavobacteriales bacterium]
MEIRVGIIEDQKKIRDRLIARLGFYDDIHIVMEAHNAIQGIEKLNQLPKDVQPQVILMDIEMSGMTGIEATKKIKTIYPEIDILIQTVFEDDEKIYQSIHAGASGYLLKDDPIGRYVESIKELYGGGAMLSPSIASKLLSYIKTNQDSKVQEAKKVQEEFSLSDREVDIIKGIVDDLSTEEIASNYFISPHTVRTHIKNVYSKLHVHTRAAMVRFALSKGLIQ